MHTKEEDSQCQDDDASVDSVVVVDVGKPDEYWVVSVIHV